MDYVRWIEALDRSFDLFTQRIAQHLPNILGSILLVLIGWLLARLLRAAIILIIPIAAVTNILIVYPLVFAITSISIFFRPARVAALPRAA